jgi:hypothetical protein
VIGSGVCTAITFVGLKPGSTDWTRQSARMSRPADTSSTTDAATSEATRIDRSRSVRRPAPARDPSRRPERSRSLTTRMAGTTPNPIPVATVTIAANTRTRGSMAVASPTGSVAGTSRASSGTAAMATATPSSPPAADSKGLSVNSWRTSRSRPAPIAVRIASSFRRFRTRASRRPARFVHAMSRTQSDAPVSPTSSSRLCADT